MAAVKVLLEKPESLPLHVLLLLLPKVQLQQSYSVIPDSHARLPSHRILSHAQSAST